MHVAELPTPDYGGRALVTLHHFLFIDVFAMLVVSLEHQNVITNKVYLLQYIQICVAHMYLFANLFTIKYYVFEKFL